MRNKKIKTLETLNINKVPHSYSNSYDKIKCEINNISIV